MAGLESGYSTMISNSSLILNNQGYCGYVLHKWYNSLNLKSQLWNCSSLTNQTLCQSYTYKLRWQVISTGHLYYPINKCQPEERIDLVHEANLHDSQIFKSIKLPHFSKRFVAVIFKLITPLLYYFSWHIYIVSTFHVRKQRKVLLTKYQLQPI